MSSAPDILLGVSRAADTLRQRDATARLEQMGRSATANAADATGKANETTSDWLSQVTYANSNSDARPATAAPATRYASRPSETSNDKKSEVYVQFEALLLQNMVESMMPEDSEALFGSGTAGKVWKSMLAERVAAEIARSGVIGIAKQVASGPSTSSVMPPPTVSKADQT